MRGPFVAFWAGARRAWPLSPCLSGLLSPLCDQAETSRRPDGQSELESGRDRAGGPGQGQPPTVAEARLAFGAGAAVRSFRWTCWGWRRFGLQLFAEGQPRSCASLAGWPSWPCLSGLLLALLLGFGLGLDLVWAWLLGPGLGDFPVVWLSGPGSRFRGRCGYATMRVLGAERTALPSPSPV